MSVQCGRKVDAFKAWFMLKARGEDYFEKLVDNAFDRANYLAQQIKLRPGTTWLD
jgi:sulfinoalanine decarboxylase